MGGEDDRGDDGEEREKEYAGAQNDLDYQSMGVRRRV
jgi:hypothetical protein